MGFYIRLDILDFDELMMNFNDRQIQRMEHEKETE